MPLRTSLGSTSAVTCGSGSCGEPREVVAQQWYHPYGSVRAITGTLPTDITFTGQRSDATGLYFYNARYYSPLSGRFLSADSIVPEPGNPQALNRYSYVYNAPIKHTDPTGHLPTPCANPDGMGYHAGCSGGSSPTQRSMPKLPKSAKPSQTVQPPSAHPTLRSSSTNLGRAPVELNPFAYDTMGMQIGGLAKLIGGIELELAFYWNQQVLRDAWEQKNANLLSGFDFSVNLQASLSVGFSAEYGVVGSLIGTDGGVLAQSQVEGISPNNASVNVLVCPTRNNGFCIGGSATLDLTQGRTKAVEYVPFTAYGRGLDLSVDVGQASSWIIYASPSTGFRGPRVPFMPVR